MTFKQHFCPSPWIHMRINNSGAYEYCRWMVKDDNPRLSNEHNIQNQRPLEYFQNSLKEIRVQLLNGESPPGCQDCRIMEQNHKVSGRQRQLLKIGVQELYFEKSLASSPMRPAFDYSATHQGHTAQTVVDWQIDLGNYCNSACVFCSPDSSSRLASEFKRIGLIDQVPPVSWCDDPALLEQFIQDLIQSPGLRYLHFIGGETLITPGFEKILSALVKADLAKNITVGFTTNLTTWSNSVVDLLTKFDQINLGVSIESFTPVNDYVRWPSQIDQVCKVLDQWIALAKSYNWLVQLRITPSCLSVHELTSVYDYAWKHELAVESCNFISRPEFMRIGVLPAEQRDQIATDLQLWLDQHQVEHDQQIINTRDPNIARQQIYQDVTSYLNYLKSAPDETFRLGDLVSYLKKLESSRGNSILTYLPQYEELFRSAGY